MSFRSLLVPLAGDATDDTALDLALTAAGAEPAHIRALLCRADPRTVIAMTAPPTDLAGVGMIADRLLREEEQAAATVRARFEDWRRRRDLPRRDAPDAAERHTVGWVERVGDVRQSVAAEGRLADLIVVPMPSDAEGTDAPALEAALFETGRPVLTAPAGAAGNVGDTVVIAWNGSVEANRALAAAMPLLPRCRQIFVFGRGEAGRAHADPAELVAYLAWHGLEADRLGVFQGHGSIGADLLAAARDVGARLVVMGAYGHGPLRERVFGGVTRHMLRHAPMPLLLAH